MTVLRSGSASDVGRVRSVNEDHLLETGDLFAVADGMGGHAGGEVASSLAIDVLHQAFGTAPTADGLVEAVRRANQAVWERSHRDAEVRGMGTTLTAAALVPTHQGDRLVVANVGDSRAYRWTAGRLVQMTTDHSVAEELVARGELSEAEAAVHPHRHILTRALGVGPEVDVDSWELAPSQGERFILCSDGLTNELDEARIARVLAEVADPEEAARALVSMANDHGGSDNITVVILDVLVADEGSPPTSSDQGGAPVPASVTLRQGADGSAPDVGGGAAGAMASAAMAGMPGGATTTARTAVTSRTVMVARPAAQHSRPGADGAGAGQADAPTGPPPDMMARHVASALTDVMGRGAQQRRELAALVDRRAPRRRLTLRVALFALLVLAVGAGAGAVVHAYAEDAWYVRLSGGHVTIIRGRPGGFLGFEPHVVRTTSLTSADVLAYRVAQLQAGVSEGSLQAADRFVANLHSEFCAVQPTSASCASPTAPSAALPAGAAPGTSSGLPPAARRPLILGEVV